MRLLDHRRRQGVSGESRKNSETYTETVLKQGVALVVSGAGFKGGRSTMADGG